MAQVIAFMEGHHGQFGVEPMCTVLQIAPSTWHAHARAHAAAKADPHKRSKRARSDDALARKIQQVFDDNFGVHGVRKVCGSYSGMAKMSPAALWRG
ncbi:MAG: hypothetical protein RLY86_594 [Pseudomonadota bacterium]